MPTEPLAALIYVCLLLPGIAFVWKYEGHRSVVKRSAFRETATVVIASVASLIAVLLAHYVLAFFSEAARTTLRQFFLDPGELFRNDSQLFLGTVLLDLTAAVGVGAFFGSRSADRLRKKFDVWSRALRCKQLTGLDRGLSGWGAAFERMPDHLVNVGVQLKSGAWLQGVLHTYSQTGDEGPDRALTLSGSVYYRRADGDEVHPLEDYSVVIVQASEIDYLTVGYAPAPVADVEASRVAERR